MPEMHYSEIHADLYLCLCQALTIKCRFIHMHVNVVLYLGLTSEKLI